MRSYKLLVIKVCIALSSICFLSFPLAAAERINFNYGLLGFRLAIADLELFAEQGVISDRLNFYLKRVPAEKHDQLRRFLQQSYSINPVLAYRFGKTSVGEKVLQRLGDIVQIPEDLNGFYALRAAIVNTAVASEDFNFINVAKRFPVNIKLNLEEVLALTKQISRSEAENRNFIYNLKGQESSPLNIQGVQAARSLSVLGSFPVVKQQIRFADNKRDRQILTNLYIPQRTPNKVSKLKVPVIVVSNGLGARPQRFDELANHLASYGFAVAVLDHPGSNYDRQQEFIKGLHQENFAASDYIDRPLDVSFVLDSLSELNNKQFDNQFDLEQVGIFGYSIGGTTALSLTGAKIDFEQLSKDCQDKLDLTNISILYQCRALEIEDSRQLNTDIELKDERIKAAFLFVPFGKSLFGQSKLAEITTPMLWQVVDRDFLTSLTKEQLPIYAALDSSDRYLVISENLPHSTAILAKERSQSQKNQVRVSRKYQNIISLVFFRRYLMMQNSITQENFPPQLNSHLMRSIEEKPYSLNLTHEKPVID